MKQVLLYILPLLLLGSSGPAYAGEPVHENIVKLYVTVNEPSYFTPWQMLGSYEVEGSGCIVEDNLILTNAHVVSGRTFILVKRSGQTKKYVAEVLFVGHDCDLALLQVEDKDFFSDVPPLGIGSLPRVGDEVAAYGYPNNAEQVTVTRGIVSRISNETYAHSSVKLLSCQIDAAINKGSSGGPILSGNKIVGIAMMAGWGDDEGYMVSVPVIEHFFTDIEDGRYDGFPALALHTQTLENTTMQEFYGLTDNVTGILIRDVYYRSPARGLLFPDDVILQINQYDVAADGTVSIRGGERTDYAYAVQEKQAGEFVHLKVLRESKIRDIAVKLDFSIFDHNVVHYSQYDHRPKYFIYGGLVFSVLSEKYLRSFGDSWSWRGRAPINLMYARYLSDPNSPKEEIIVISDILADEINIGYKKMEDEIVTAVNGKQVNSLRELIDAVETNKKEYMIIETDYRNRIILNKKEAKESTARILDKYEVPSDRSVHYRKERKEEAPKE